MRFGLNQSKSKGNCLSYQRQLFVMCQSNKDYQLWKQKFKTRILQRNIITYFAIIRAVKSMLTGISLNLTQSINDQTVKPQDNNKNQLSSQENTSLLKTSNINNPYSHLLCFRLLKDSFLKVDYGLLTLIEAELTNLIFNVSIFDCSSQDEQRGRAMYLQGTTSSTIDNNLPMTHEQLQIVGYSVHKIVMETLMTLGNGLTTLPYHPAQTGKQLLKSDQSFLTDRLLTPRTINSTFTNEFQKQKMKALTQQLKNYPSKILPSLSHDLYVKTKKMSIKYPEKLHYFKQKQIDKFKKDVAFNSEQKQYHILKFYQFLIAFVIRQQVDTNQKILHNLKLKNQVQYDKFRAQIISSNNLSFKTTLKNILNTKDRFAMHFTIIYLTNSLKIIAFGQKGKQTFSQQNSIITFFSVCQIVEYLTVSMSKKIDQKENLTFIELDYFNLEMFLAVDQILSHFLANAYLTIFQANNNKISQSFFYGYARNYFYNLVVKLQKLRLALIASSQKYLKRQFGHSQLHYHLTLKQTLLRRLSNVLFKFYDSRYFQDLINNIQILKSQQVHLKKFQSIKELFQIQLQQIEYTKIEIPRETINTIKNQIQLIETFDLIKLAATKCSIPQQTDDTSINQQRHYFISERFAQNIKIHQKSLDFSSNPIEEQDLQITINDSRNLKNQKYHHFSDDEIPKQPSTRPKSIETYQFKINPNDISKLNHNKNLSQSNFYVKPDLNSSSKPPQITKLSFKQSLENGTSRLNLMNRDTETLRNLSRRKYKRKHTNSRVNMLPLSSETLDQALSCPTYMEENSQSIDFGQTYQQLPSQNQISPNSKDFQKIVALQRQIQNSRKEQEKLMTKIKTQEQTISSLLSSDSKKYSDIPQKITRMPPKRQGTEVFCIKDSISKKVHMINVNVGGQSTSQMQQNTQKTGNTQKKNQLGIKDTESYEINFYQATPNQNKTKLKSRFNQSNDDSLQNVRTKFDSTDKKHLSNGQSAMKKEFKTPERFGNGKDLTATDSQQSYLRYFHFPIKIKKDLLKKKVLIIKDQLIEIGMITQLERIIPSEKTLSMANEQKNKRSYNNFKLKSSLYITPLTKLSKIQLNIKDTFWLEHEFLTNKVKQNLKADNQYISYVDFWLIDIENHQYLNYLPDLEVKVQIQENAQNKDSQLGNKHYKFSLPLFINKFFTEESIDKSEIRQLLNRVSSVDQMQIEVSKKLIKETKDLEKHFSKFIELPLLDDCTQHLMATKLKFMNQCIYVCFGRQFGFKSIFYTGKQQLKGLSFKIISGSELGSSSKKVYKDEAQKQLVSNLLITSMFSLLTD